MTLKNCENKMQPTTTTKAAVQSDEIKEADDDSLVSLTSVLCTCETVKLDELTTSTSRKTLRKHHSLVETCSTDCKGSLLT
ncbi:hypothetical protein Trydic_g15685 [Trypoxylus dichotomus]